MGRRNLHTYSSAIDQVQDKVYMQNVNSLAKDQALQNPSRFLSIALLFSVGSVFLDALWNRSNCHYLESDCRESTETLAFHSGSPELDPKPDCPVLATTLRFPALPTMLPCPATQQH